jgi:WD40 repeat protein
MLRSRASDNKLRQVWTANLPDHVIGLSWISDGKFLAAAAVSGPITVFDATNSKPAHELKGHGFGTTAIAWQPGRAVLASAGQDGQVRLWKDGQEIAALDGGATWVERLAWNAAGTMLAASAGKKVRIWCPDGQLVRELPVQAGTVTDIGWRPGTNQLAVLAYGAANLYDPGTGELVRAFAWKGSPLALAWSPDGKVLAHGNQDATVHFWYCETGADLQMSGYPSKVRELSWDFTNRYLATGGGPMPCIWDCGGPKGPEGSKPQMFEGHEDNLTAVAFQSHGYLLASAGVDGRVILWQPANKKSPKMGEHRFESEASCLRWSPDDKLLAAGCGSGQLSVFRIQT